MLERVHGVYDGTALRLLYAPEQIAATVKGLAQRISADYAGESLLFVVVLKGALFFAADLAREIRLPLTIDFVRLASYRGTDSTGTVTVIKDLEQGVTGRHVLVVEDIVDTGRTLTFLLESLRARGPRSLKVCALVDKTGRREVGIVPDYAGIAREDGFLVGYGLDLDEKYRHLPGLYEVNE